MLRASNFSESSRTRLKKSIKVIERSSPSEKPILKWIEQFDQSFLKNTVDLVTGGVKLNIPLVDVSPTTGWTIKFALSYNSEAKTADFIGTGWSIYLPIDFIFVEHQESIFPEDAMYYVSVKGQYIQLKLIRVDDLGVKHFQLADQPSDMTDALKIQYIEEKQQWIFDGVGERVIYGTVDAQSGNTALQTSLGWKNWRGIGHEEETLEPFIDRWFLTTRYDKHRDEYLHYKYEQDVSVLPKGQKYTTAVRLMSISNDKKDVSIEFQYSEKSKNEYEATSPFNEQNIQFPIRLEQSHYLSRLAVRTPVYQQDYIFNYDLKKESRFLTSVKQAFVSEEQTLLEFKYDLVDGSNLLKSCLVPTTKAGINFSHDVVQPPLATASLRFPVVKQPKVVQGPDYTIIAHKIEIENGEKLILRITDRAMTKTFVNCLEDSNFECPFIEDDIKHYVIYPGKKSFIAFVETNKKRIMLTVHREKKDVWTLSSRIDFNKKALIYLSEKMILGIEENTSDLIVLELIDAKWEKSEISLNSKPPFTRLTASRKTIVVSNDRDLLVVYQDLNKNWIQKLIESDLRVSNQELLNKIDVDPDVRENILVQLNQNGLQIANNLIGVVGISEVNEVLVSSLRLFLLDENHDLVISESYEIRRENILELTKDVDQDTSKFFFGYIYDEGMFKLRIKSLAGEIMEDINKIKNKNERADQLAAILNDLNENPGWTKMFKTNSLINWYDYMIQTGIQGVRYGSSVLYRMSGTKFVTEAIEGEESVKLGNEFRLKTNPDDDKVLKLYKKQKEVKTISMYAPNHFINRYPMYLAYQAEESVVEVITFKDADTIGNIHRFADETIMFESNLENLMTLERKSKSSSNHIIVRPTSTLILPAKETFVKKMSIIDEDIHRETTYERSYKINSDMSYAESLTLIPGANKTAHGWYKATRVLNPNKGEVTKVERWFDGAGNKIAEHKEKPENQSNEMVENDSSSSDNVANPTKLFDYTGKLLISDFTPYNVADETVAYFGFESYESNKIGGVSDKKKWNYQESDVVKNQFAFTGENFLRLKDDTSYFGGILQPKEHNLKYLVSTWIRSATPLESNATVPFFTAKISAVKGQKITDLQAQVKYNQGDWFYLEIIIDLDTILANKSQNKGIEINVRVQGMKGTQLDLDHLRFAPIHLDNQITVYDSYIIKPTAIIQSNGQISRIIYNSFKEEIANIRPDGQIERFSTISKTGYNSPLKKYAVSMESCQIAIKPDYGFYETFDPFSVAAHWVIGDESNWNIAPGQLWHRSAKKSQINVKPGVIDSDSVGLRLYITLENSKSSVGLNVEGTNLIELNRKADGNTMIKLPNDAVLPSESFSGELIILLEHNYAWIWHNGVLLFDGKMQKPNDIIWKQLTFSIEGNVLIEDLIVMTQTQVSVDYFNSLGEKTQSFELEDFETAVITEKLYDDVGRESIITKPTRVTRDANKPLLAYRPDFVQNKDPTKPNSVWITGTIEGEANKLNPNDLGYPYTQTKYAANPLNDEIGTGLPGKDYSHIGPYFVKKSKYADIDFLKVVFPESRGYQQTVDYVPNGSYKVSITDENGNKVASYVRVAGSDHILSTFEYDEANRLVKMLPPVYHEKVGTATTEKPYLAGDKHLTNEEKHWQNVFATSYVYNRDGKLLRKVMPDTGITEHLYNKAGQTKFVILKDKNEDIKEVVYYNYNKIGQVKESGLLTDVKSVSDLGRRVEEDIKDESGSFQTFDFTDSNSNPLTRGHARNFVTQNNNEKVLESILFNDRQQIISRSININDMSSTITKKYVSGNMRSLTYPSTSNGKPFEVVHTYNKQDQLIAIGTPDNPDQFIKFTYQPDGQLKTEEYQLTGLNRQYFYNSPGFLTNITDSFLREDILYEKAGYGQSGFGDGMIMSTIYVPKWMETANPKWFQLQEDEVKGRDSKHCLKALTDKGYVTKDNKPVKLYIRNTEVTLPLDCDGSTGQNVAKILAQKQTPKTYGYKFTYGNHQELTKAKYLTDDIEALITPLQPNTFANRIPKLSLEDSKKIFELLKQNKFITTDQKTNDSTFSIAKDGNPLFRFSNLLSDLKTLNRDYQRYATPIQRLILHTIANGSTLSVADFKDVLLKWERADESSADKVKAGQQIGQMLLDKGYLPAKPNSYISALDSKFVQILKPYSKYIQKIVSTLHHHFAYALGQTSFDIESYKIDPNGNHRQFYTGFNRYELLYKEATNQIQQIIIGYSRLAKKYDVEHDSRGNIIKAPHKNIKQIEYHPVSQRTTRIVMDNGLKIEFSYDAQGERLLKRVYNPDGTISHEIYYVRDEQGKVLMDRQIRHGPIKKTIETQYLYGPKGLIGFIRDNEFYSVTLDHMGSVRLVIKDNAVVAAFDYLPYGELMRSFGDQLDLQIAYRYNGQEFDIETGLYNFHARFYDPSIGRFYQPDPKAQYFNPYLYAGNSPISMIDPNGEEVVLVVTAIVCGLAGLYLGGAAANNRWNPADWDYKDFGTYSGMIFGALSGAALPFGFAGSAALIGEGLTTSLGVLGAYLTTASINQEWDYTKWDMEKPKTWAGLLKGFSMGAGFVHGMKEVHNVAQTFTAVQSKIFLSSSYTLGGVFLFKGGLEQNDWNFAFWQWDYTNPSTWNSMVVGFKSGFTLNKKAIGKYNTVKKLSGNVVKYAKKFKTLVDTSLQRQMSLIHILKTAHHPLNHGTANSIISYFMGATPRFDLDVSRWCLASVSSYQGVLDKVFLGKRAAELLALARDTKIVKTAASMLHSRMMVESMIFNQVDDVLKQQGEDKKKDTSFDTKPRLSDNKFNPLFSTSFKAISNMFNWVPPLFGATSDNSSYTSQIQPIYTQTDFNGTLQLVDLAIRKLTGEKYQAYTDNIPSHHEISMQAIEITDTFEQTLIDLSSEVGLSIDEMEFDSYELYQDVIKTLKTGNMKKLNSILHNTLVKATNGKVQGSDLISEL